MVRRRQWHDATVGHERLHRGVIEMKYLRFVAILALFGSVALSAQGERPLSTRVDEALKAAGVPIHGIWPDDPNDKRTWRVDFAPEATAADRATAAQVIDDFDPDDLSKEPRLIAARDILRRMTGDEHRWLTTLSARDDEVLRLWTIMRAGGEVNTNTPEFSDGWTAIMLAGIPSIWPDQAVAEQRLAEIIAR